MSLLRLAISGLHVLKHRGGKGLYRAVIRKIRRGPLWKSYSEEAMLLASHLDFDLGDVEASQALQKQFAGFVEVRSITWFLPDFFNPYYGGIHTILRFAAYAKEKHHVCNQFVIAGGMAETQIADRIACAFPALAGELVQQIRTREELTQIRASDAAIATLWSTAYFLLHYNATKRKFYFLQDFEPIFYPAGSTYAQVEATYQFGFYGIANTCSIKKIYTEQYGGAAEFFTPAIDTKIFQPASTRPAKTSSRYTVFFYGRPEHPRNGFELGVAALIKLKQKLGDHVRIVCAGDQWEPSDFGINGIIENLGVLSYAQTAKLYRMCDAGLIMMFTRHPSYLPMELMASGCLVVSNRNPATTWLLHDGENCLLSHASASCLADTLERGLLDAPARARITANALQQVQTEYSNWEDELAKIYRFMCEPVRKSK